MLLKRLRFNRFKMMKVLFTPVILKNLTMKRQIKTRFQKKSWFWNTWIIQTLFDITLHLLNRTAFILLWNYIKGNLLLILSLLKVKRKSRWKKNIFGKSSFSCSQLFDIYIMICRSCIEILLLQIYWLIMNFRSNWLILGLLKSMELSLLLMGNHLLEQFYILVQRLFSQKRIQVRQIFGV